MRFWWRKPSKDRKKKLQVENIFSSVHMSCIGPVVFRRKRGDSNSPKEFQARGDPLSIILSKQVLCNHTCYQMPEGAEPPRSSTHVANSSDTSCDGPPRNPPSTRLLNSGRLITKACAVVGEALSDTSSEADDTRNSHLMSQASEITSPSRLRNSREMVKPAYSLFNYQTNPISSKQRHVNCKEVYTQPHESIVLNAPDSAVSSPCRSPTRVVGHEWATEHGFWPGKQHVDAPLSPGSVYYSKNNSFRGEIPCQNLWMQCKCSPECSPLPSPRILSPGSGSRRQSGRISPIHPRAGGTAADKSVARPDDGRQQSHPLPLPPVQIYNPSPFTLSYSPPATSPMFPRSSSRTDNSQMPASRWKKGRALGRGTFGQVYLGFNSESGEMCAMKEVTLFLDDTKCKESAQQLRHEVLLLSRLHHPNIVQYYGSEMVDDKLYIYLEYVSGGSIHKILQEYGPLGEAAIRSYTLQILSGLAYLHAKNTIHRDIKGANILVEPNGKIKLADFGMAKHITGSSDLLSFKGSPYWMAPEVITNSGSFNLTVDIWSLGCTVLEMATAKPPWSKYEGVAALFKVGNSKELPDIPHHLSDECKDFVMKCLQRNPSHRPSAVQLLEHPFVKNCSPMERPVQEPSVKRLGSRHSGVAPYSDSSEPIIRSGSPKVFPEFSDGFMVKYHSGPLSPSEKSFTYSPPPQHMKGRVSPLPSGASTPPGGSSTKTFALPPYHSNTVNHAHNPKTFRGLLQKARSTVEKRSREFHSFEHEFESSVPQKDELYGTHLMLGDRVPQHLVGSPLRQSLGSELKPSRTVPSRNYGF